MTLHILKKDLRSKPVTNLILLLFITLSVMCAAAGVNNALTVLTAQEDYYDRAGITDCMAWYYPAADSTVVEDALLAAEEVSSVRAEHSICVFKADLQTENSEEAEFYSIIMFTPLAESAMTYFDEENRELDPPEPGEVYVPKKLVDKGLFRVGETFTLTLGETELTLTVAGTAKDAVFGSESMGGARVLTSVEDYETLSRDAQAASRRGKELYISTEDTAAVSALLAGLEEAALSVITRDTMNLINYLDLAIAGILVLLSVCLIVVFLTILRYTVRFTLSQEMREIGVMKAVGLQNKAVERIYLIKYAFMAALGAVLGFAASIPFGRLLLKTLSETIVIEEKNVWSVNILCTVAVAGLVMLFCRRSIKKQRKITPVDAVRSGANGEDGVKVRRFSLAGSKMRPRSFLPIKHIFTGVRQYLVMGLTCTICLLLILVVADSVNTLDSGNMLSMCGLQPSDVVWLPEDLPEEWQEYLDEDFHGDTADLEQWLLVFRLLRDDMEELGIRAEVFMDINYSANLRRGENAISTPVWYGLNISAEEYDYLSGTAPVGDHEIALTPLVADSLGAEIGDTVLLSDGVTEEEYLVTGLFQSLMNTGTGARVNAQLPMEATGCVGVQINFEDGLTAKEKADRIALLKENFPEKFYTATEFLYTVIGNVAGILHTVRNVLAPLMLAICAFVMVLMESSFIDKEKGEIALMKAVGFRSSFIWGVHLRRTAVTVLLALVPAELLALPLAQATIGIAFRSLGVVRVDFFVNPLEAYLVWPAAVLLTALAAVGLTALTANRITARDAADIE